MEVDVADLCPPVSEAVSFETSSCVGLLFSRFLLGGLEGALLILGFSSARCGSAAAVVSGMISSVVKDERAVRFAGASLAAVWGGSRVRINFPMEDISLSVSESMMAQGMETFIT